MSSRNSWLPSRRSASGLSELDAVTEQSRFGALQGQAWQIESVDAGTCNRTFIARIGMTHDPRRWIVPKHTLDAARSLWRSVGDNHHAGVLRIADSDASAVMQRDPCGPAGTVEQRIEQRPVGHSVRAVAHSFGLAVQARNRAAAEMIATDDDLRIQLPAPHHFVERDA